MPTTIAIIEPITANTTKSSMSVNPPCFNLVILACPESLRNVGDSGVVPMSGTPQNDESCNFELFMVFVKPVAGQNKKRVSPDGKIHCL